MNEKNKAMKFKIILEILFDFVTTIILIIKNYNWNYVIKKK